jgi:hypothetical protein
VSHEFAPHFVKRAIVDPLTEVEVAELRQQLGIANLLVESRTRLPDTLVKALAVCEERFNATADQSRLINAVEEGWELGYSKNDAIYPNTAWEYAASKLGNIAPKTVQNRYGKLLKVEEAQGLPPLANRPKK